MTKTCKCDIIIIVKQKEIGKNEKGNKGISLNDFDKIPLEIIIFIDICIGFIPFIGIMEVSNINTIIMIKTI